MRVTMENPVVEQDILLLHFRKIGRFGVIFGTMLFWNQSVVIRLHASDDLI